MNPATQLCYVPIAVADSYLRKEPDLCIGSVILQAIPLCDFLRNGSNVWSRQIGEEDASQPAGKRNIGKHPRNDFLLQSLDGWLMEKQVPLI
jgi:hypothetical protein